MSDLTQTPEYEELAPGTSITGEVPLSMMLDLSLPVSIELGRTKMTVQEILNLGRGSVVQLDRLAGEVPVRHRVAEDRDPDAARRLVRRDDEVDDLHRRMFADLMGRMIADPQQIDRSMTFVLVGRNLERIGDLATNIAEDVIFLVEGRIVRHEK
mgnify:CR=1 FL=1